MPCTPYLLVADGVTEFPTRPQHSAGTPVDIAVTGCGLMNLNPNGGHARIAYQQWGHVDADLNWHSTGWGIFSTDEVKYDSRDETHLYGVTYYPSHGRINDGMGLQTEYYNPNAYWTPPAPGDPPPVGGDPTATVGQDPVTVDPPPVIWLPGKAYKYATFKTYDQMGVNRTGLNLAEDPDAPGTFLDPYDSANPVLRFLYDDQDALHSNLTSFDWEPDGEATRNQSVAMMTAMKRQLRNIRKIARNITSWKEIGVYSGWDSVGGSNVQDVSEENVEGYAAAQVERYGRPPNQFRVTLLLEPASGTPARGTDPDPALGWQPQPFRDFGIGDRILARCRKGYLDTGDIAARIMDMKVAQADANNNVRVEVSCVPHVGDLSEITVV